MPRSDLVRREEELERRIEEREAHLWQLVELGRIRADELRRALLAAGGGVALLIGLFGAIGLARRFFGARAA